jgi:hypothetical protein
MKRVICVNDKRLPEGGNLVEGKEYEVEDEFLNNFDQRVYIIAGINNYGMTKMGLRWYGYNSERFASADNVYEEATEFNYALN